MILYFFLTFITGFLLTKILIPDLKNNMLIYAYSIGIGISVESILSFLFINSGYMNKSVFILAYLCLYLILLIIVYKRRTVSSNCGDVEKTENILMKPETSSNLPVTILFILIFLISASEIILHFIKEPYGSWDAMFIWNFRSKFIYTLHSLGMDWKLLFNPNLEWSHLDYPLLLPLYNFKNQMLYGSYNIMIPKITALMFFSATLFMLTGGIKEIVNVKNAFIAGIVLLSTKAFIWESGSECADVPLCFYILAAFVSLYLHQKNSKSGYIIISYFFAASAAFCKNEGILFFLIFTVLSSIYIKKDIKYLFAGCCIPLFCLIWSKLFLYSKSDLFFDQTLPLIINKLFDFNRFKQIVIHYIENTGNLYNLIVLCILAILTGLRKNSIYYKLNMLLFLCLVLAAAGYFVIYMITPNDLNWHLLTSAMRLSVQYTGLFIFFIFVCFYCCDKKISGAKK